MEAYAGLVEEAATHGGEAVRGCIAARELMLGYLARAMDAGTGRLAFSGKPHRIRLVEDILSEAEQMHRRLLQLAGCKRIGAIVHVLKRKL